MLKKLCEYFYRIESRLEKFENLDISKFTYLLLKTERYQDSRNEIFIYSLKM